MKILFLLLAFASSAFAGQLQIFYPLDVSATSAANHAVATITKTGGTYRVIVPVLLHTNTSVNLPPGAYDVSVIYYASFGNGPFLGTATTAIAIANGRVSNLMIKRPASSSFALEVWENVEGSNELYAALLWLLLGAGAAAAGLVLSPLGK